MTTAKDILPIPASPDERQALARLLVSETFSHTPRLRALLSFMIEAYLDGRADDMSEQAIGQAVFKRSAGYSAGDDNIVRVTVRHLRSRLAEFYSGEGRGEEHIFVIPKGKYVPGLVLREQQAP